MVAEWKTPQQVIDESMEMTEAEWQTLRRWNREQRDREVEALKEFEGRLKHARNTDDCLLDALINISAERWAEPVAIVREEREIEALREQLREAQFQAGVEEVWQQLLAEKRREQNDG